MPDLNIWQCVLFFGVIPYLCIPIFVYIVTFVFTKAKFDALVQIESKSPQEDEEDDNDKEE